MSSCLMDDYHLWARMLHLRLVGCMRVAKDIIFEDAASLTIYCITFCLLSGRSSGKSPQICGYSYHLFAADRKPRMKNPGEMSRLEFCRSRTDLFWPGPEKNSHKSADFPHDSFCLRAVEQKTSGRLAHDKSHVGPVSRHLVALFECGLKYKRV